MEAYILSETVASWWIPTLVERVLSKRKIPVRSFSLYTSVLCSGIGFVCAYVAYTNKVTFWERGIAFLFIWLFIFMAMMDVSSGYVLNIFTYGGCILFLLFRFLFYDAWMEIFAALGVGIFFYLFAQCTGGMGLADSKVFTMAGLVVGWPEILVACWLAIVCAGIYVLLLFCFRGSLNLKQKIPFVPYIAFGSFVAYIWGKDLLSFYFQILD